MHYRKSVFCVAVISLIVAQEMGSYCMAMFFPDMLGNAMAGDHDHEEMGTENGDSDVLPAKRSLPFSRLWNDNDWPPAQNSPTGQTPKRNSGWGPSFTYYGAWRVLPSDIQLYNNTKTQAKGRPASKLCYISPIACFGRRLQKGTGENRT